MEENFRPSPVNPTTPTMIPATAQAMETATALRAPSSSPSISFSRPLRVAVARRSPVTGSPCCGATKSIHTRKRSTATASMVRMA